MTIKGTARVFVIDLENGAIILLVNAGEYRGRNVVVFREGEGAKPELFSKIVQGQHRPGDEINVEVDVVSRYSLDVVNCNT